MDGCHCPPENGPGLAEKVVNGRESGRQTLCSHPGKCTACGGWGVAARISVASHGLGARLPPPLSLGRAGGREATNGVKAPRADGLVSLALSMLAGAGQPAESPRNPSGRHGVVEEGRVTRRGCGAQSGKVDTVPLGPACDPEHCLSPSCVWRKAM